MERKWPAVLHPALLFVILAWGFNFSVVKLAYREIDPPTVGLVRYVLMAAALVLVCVGLKQSLRYPPGEALRFNFAGFLASGAYMVLFLEGMKTAGAAQGAVALATAPLWITSFAVLAKQERFTGRLLTGSLVAFGGVSVVILGGGHEGNGDAWGTLLVLVSAVVWAWSVVLMRPMLQRDSPWRVLTLTFPGAALAMVPYGLGSVLTEDWHRVTWVGAGSLAYLVLIAGVAGFWAYYKGLAEVGAARTGMAQYFVPPTAALFAWFVLGSRLSLWQLLGLGVVIGGVALANLRSQADAAPTTATEDLSCRFPDKGGVGQNGRHAHRHRRHRGDG